MEEMQLLKWCGEGARTVLSKPEDIEDAAMTAFTKVWEALNARGSREAGLAQWCRRIGRNAAIDFARVNFKNQPLSLSGVLPPPFSLECVKDERWREAFTEIEGLDEISQMRDPEPIRMAYLGFSRLDVGEALGTTRKAGASRIYRQRVRNRKAA